jgi:hypothetical protein
LNSALRWANAGDVKPDENPHEKWIMSAAKMPNVYNVVLNYF